MNNMLGNILSMTVEGRLSSSDVAAIVITGLSVVFLGLIILIFFVWLFGKIFTRGKGKTSENISPPTVQPVKKPAAVKAAPKPSVPSTDESDEIIAVIAAAVAAMGSAEGKSYRLRSVKPVQSKGARSPWSLAGIQNNTNPF